MNDITKMLLGQITDFKPDFKGAYNIREDGSFFFYCLFVFRKTYIYQSELKLIRRINV